VRTARGAEKHHDGENKSAETGSRQVPRFGFCRERQSPGSRSFFLLWDSLLGRLSIVFNVAALQNLLFPLLDLVFLLGW